MKQTAIYTIKKLGQLVLSLVFLSAVVFFVGAIAPGNPLKAYYGEAIERMSSQQLEAASQRLGLDDSIGTQYLRWLQNAFSGDFGISFQYKQPVVDVIGQVFSNTVWLTAASFILILIIGILVAIYCVRNEGKFADKFLCRLGVATGSIPEFFVALILIMIFSVILSWFPQSGANTIGQTGLVDRLWHLALPVFSIVISHFWYCAYLMRNRLSEEVSKEYVLMCKVKGLTERQIIYRHCLKNIMPSVANIMAIFLPHLLGGAYVVEIVFSYPGLGKLGLESAQYHDYNMLMVICLITGTAVIVSNMIAQIINEKLAPQASEERGQIL